MTFYSPMSLRRVQSPHRRRSTVTRDDLERWFGELGLDPAFVPPPIRPVDAFEKVSGPAGIRITYPLDPQPPGRRRRRRQDGQGREATLMIRHVRRDSGQIVRHLVREVRDEAATRLSYDTRLAECVFHRDNPPPRTAQDRCTSLPTAPRSAPSQRTSRTRCRPMLAGIKGAYQRHCTYLTADRFRAVIKAITDLVRRVRQLPPAAGSRASTRP